MIVALRFVHRTARGAPAAGHPGFGRRLPAGAYCDVPDREGQDRGERRQTPNEDHDVPRMGDAPGRVNLPPVASACCRARPMPEQLRKTGRSSMRAACTAGKPANQTCPMLTPNDGTGEGAFGQSASSLERWNREAPERRVNLVDRHPHLSIAPPDQQSEVAAITLVLGGASLILERNPGPRADVPSGVLH